MMNQKEIIRSSFFLIVCSFFPPILGIFVSLYKYLKTKKVGYAISFFSFFVLFVTYNSLSVDNIGRFFSVYTKILTEYWYMGDPLVNLMRFGVRNMGFQCSHFFYIYILFVYLCWFYTFKNVTNLKSSLEFGILFFSMIFRNATDLLFFTMSAVFVLFLFSKRDDLTVKRFLILFGIVFLFHPGVFLVLLPALGLFFILKSNNSFVTKWGYYLYLIGLYVVLNLIFFQRIVKINTGSYFIDSLFSAYNNYTSSTSINKFAMRGFNLSGYTYFIQFWGMLIFYSIVFFFTVKCRKYIKSKMILSIFQCGFIVLLNVWSFVTLTERTFVIISLSSVLCLMQLIESRNLRWLNKSRLFCIVLFIFFFNFFRATPIFLENVLRYNSYQEIQNRSFYLPSFILLDYESFGFSDKFIKQESLVKSLSQKRREYLNK